MNETIKLILQEDEILEVPIGWAIAATQNAAPDKEFAHDNRHVVFRGGEDGSLTTPPCTENVDWMLAIQSLEVAEADIAKFAALYPTNARTVTLQPAARSNTSRLMR